MGCVAGARSASRYPWQRTCFEQPRIEEDLRMLGAKVKEKLAQDIALWQADGLISPGTRDTLERRLRAARKD
jgi:hypothetical protein